MSKTSSKIFLNYFKFIIPVAIILLTVWFFTSSSQNEQENIRFQVEKLEETARISASLLDQNSIKQIKSSGDYNTTWYNSVKNQIVSVTQANSNIDILQILKIDINKSVKLVSIEERNVIGQDFDIWKEMTEASGEKKVTSKIISDEENEQTNLYAFAPIDENIVLMVGKNSENIESNITETLAFPALIFGIFFLITVIVLFVELKNLSRGTDVIELALQKLRKHESGSLLGNKDFYLSELHSSIKSLESSLKDNREQQDEREKIQKQIKELLKIVSSAAEGDFTQKAEVTADALGALADSFNIMVSDLSDLIRDVKKAAEQVASSTQGILNNTDGMAQGASSQAMQTENISKLAKEMAELINNTNLNAQRASEAAKKAKDVAEQGGEIVKKSNEAMQRIRDSVREVSKQMKVLTENSVRIGEITDFIGEIASRTNLLALNASIEAARAGEAGRGFTVVADEIRNLAERSSTAAGEIAELIEDIQTGTVQTMQAIENGTMEVTEGTVLVDKAGDALKEILLSVEISTTSAVDISNATEEQTKFSTDIVSSIEHISGIAKETAEGAKESKESASTLEFLSKNLNKTVEKFRLAE